MTASVLPARLLAMPRLAWLPWSTAAIAFAVLFAQPLSGLIYEWWRDPEAGHGLLLFPLACILAWRRGIGPGTAPQPRLGLALLVGAVTLRYGAALAAELYTMRLSVFVALCAVIVFTWGVRQLRHWWLPLSLTALSIPLPTVVLASLALPLQLKASQMGAWLLEARDVPVRVAGNVIHLPGHALFVTEACSGLRSLTSLVALGLLLGGMVLHRSWTRAALVVVALPVAMALNGIRVFATGFLAYYVDPSLATGVIHWTEGWVIFAAAFVTLGGVAWLLRRTELRIAASVAA